MRRRVHPRTLNPRLPQGLEEARAMSLGSEPPSQRARKPRTLVPTPGRSDSRPGQPGAAGRGPKVRSAASHALTEFRGQGHAAGRWGRPAGWNTGGGAGQGAQPAPRKGCRALLPGRAGPGQALPAAGAGREPAESPAAGAGTGAPRARCCGVPGPPGGRRRATSSGERTGGLAPPQPVTYLGAERRGSEEPATERCGPGRRRAGLPCPPPAHRAGPPLPGAPLQGRAANWKLERPRGAAAAMGPSAGSAPAAAGGQDQSGSLHLASAVSSGPQSALFCVPSSRTSSPAGTCPKERCWGHDPQTGDLLPGTELTLPLALSCNPGLMHPPLQVRTDLLVARSQ